tara:strand:- start:745 stop:1017 length:273 start_codon:yes stop_codon:yes gene_type:complete
MILPGTAFAHESGIHIHTDIPSTNIAFAETVMDKDVFAPGAQFDSKPLDEAQQEQADLTEIWTYAVIIVIGIIIARVALQIVKKRMTRTT